VRQGQQNRRGRGNNNNRNRKSQNPLSRSFESNGPDVKIRGTPAHIAEKYLTLARDAQSSGDPVLAENYLQHAEHYNRIIMAYREQLQQQGGDMNGNGQRIRVPGEGGEGDEFGDDEGGDEMMDDGLPQPVQQHHGQSHQQHQPRHSSGYDANRDRNFRGRDQNRFRDRDRHNDRGDRNDRQDRGGGDRDRQPVENRPNPVPSQDRQPDAPVEAGGGGGGEPRRRDRFQQPHEQPEFLRRPVRRTRTESAETPAPASKDEPRD
jgi:Domain of unknown function (DUF4167)